MDKERSELERYIFYFERFSNHDKSLSVATNLQKQMEQRMLQLHDRFNLEHSQLSFIFDAALILRNSRRTLKWSYAFGYFINEPKGKHLFEFHQRDLENFTEELQELLEIKYGQYFEKINATLEDFREYKDQVVSSLFKCNKVLIEFSTR